MGKMLPMLLFVVAINLSLVMFIGIDAPLSSLWDLIQGPQNWNDLSLLSLFGDVIGLASVVGIVVGSFWTKSDFLVFAGISGVLLSFGISISSLFTQFNAYPVFGTGQSYIAILIIAPLVVSYIYFVLKFWRGSD